MMSFKDKAEMLKKRTAQVYLCMKSPREPFYAKITAAITVGYALSPIDLIPDFIPVLGYLDDAVIIPFLVWLTYKITPADVWKECEKEADELWSNGRPKKWYYAIPVILIWTMVLYIIIKWIFS